MKSSFATIPLFLVCSVITGVSICRAAELSGYLSIEGSYFLKEPIFENQDRNDVSLALQAEMYHEIEDGSSITFVPFGRIDSADDKRTHFDIRELNYLWLSDRYALRLGIGKVFWGATEFVHLVDIINQTDLVEDIDEEEKLGQPMIYFSALEDWGTIDFFLMPYFRERTFPGKEGRLRTRLVVDTDNERYESGSESRHIDLAIRYSRTIGDADFGIYHFKGTGREPTLLLGADSSGNPVLIPFYEQIDQTGLDLQLVAGEWLWKLEALNRTGQGKGYYAAVGGFEYTFHGIAESRINLGLVVEYAYDDRLDEATTVYQNDAMIGLRLVLNDAADTEFLGAFLKDLDNSSGIINIQASRRFGSDFKVNLEAWAFTRPEPNDPLYAFRDDDFAKLEVAWYY